MNGLQGEVEEERGGRGPGLHLVEPEELPGLAGVQILEWKKQKKVDGEGREGTLSTVDLGYGTH